MLNRVLHLALAISLIFHPSFAATTQEKMGAPPANKIVKKKRTKKLLQWLSPDWIDLDFGKKDGEGKNSGGVNDGADGIALLNSMDLARGKSKSGNGDKSKSGNGSGGGKLTMDEGAPKGQASGQGPGDVNPGDRGGEPPGGGGQGPGGKNNNNKPQIWDKYWPVCMFFDPSVSNAQANEIVKGSVEKAAACQVNLLVIPVTITADYPAGDPAQFNQLQKQSCNMTSIGVQVASTMLASRDPLAAARMCEKKIPIPGTNQEQYDPQVSGCAQVRDVGELSEGDLAAAGSGNFAPGGLAKGGIIPSVIIPNGWDSGTATHEFSGHSGLGWVNYTGLVGQKNAGLGIGSPARPNGNNSCLPPKPDAGLLALFEAPLLETPRFEAEGPEGSGSTGGWLPPGCAQLKKTALPNTNRVAYVPNQQVYFNQNPNTKFKLGMPLWGTPPESQPPSKPPIVKTPPGGGGGGDDGGRLVVNDDAPPSGGAGGQDGRHKKQKGGGGGGGAGDGSDPVGSIVKSLRKRAQEGEVDGGAGGPGPDGQKGSGSSLTMDENAKKAGTAIPDGSSGKAGGPSGSGKGNGSQLTMDENAKKGGPSSSSGTDDGSGGASRNPASVNAGGIGGAALNGMRKEGSMDDGFFRTILKEEKRRKRIKGETLREKIKNRSIESGRPVQDR